MSKMVKISTSPGSNLINKLVFEAKIGNKESSNKLWSMYRPTVLRNINAFVSQSTALEQYRVDLFHDSYLYFIEIVNKYDFEKDHAFSYYLLTKLRERTKNRIKVKYQFPIELINDESVDNYSEFVDPDEIDRRKRYKIAFSLLTPKQKRAVYLYYFKDLSQREAADLLGISQIGFRKQLKQGEKKIMKWMGRLTESRWIRHLKKKGRL